MSKTGLGIEGQFYWFVGIIEDRMDEFGIGRVAVRCMEYDNVSREYQPHEDLVWAYPMLPFENNPVVHPPKEGTWVVGFTMDGPNGQHRVVLGTMHSGAFRPGVGGN